MKLPCYLVRDLLPLYHDSVLSEQTAADVRGHLETCADCRAALTALDDDAGAEQALAAEQRQADAAALRRVKGTLRKKRWVPAAAVAVVIFAALFVFSRVRYTLQSETRSLELEEIQSVEVKQPVYVDITLQDGCYSDGANWFTFEIPDGDGSKKALAVSLQVSRWNELFHNGRTEWRIEDVDPDVTEIYYFKNQERELVDAGIVQKENGVWAMDELPGELHLLWRRDDASADTTEDARPATPETATGETAAGR
ncbi:MAG TPA: zf-HC2 domain-containing protein [Candidatus Gemmiger faecigallinarum]|nr:zf-HC2 domain-containing protein [Candidatus Gemmiger faecigallinarum]